MHNSAKSFFIEISSFFVLSCIYPTAPSVTYVNGLDNKLLLTERRQSSDECRKPFPNTVIFTQVLSKVKYFSGKKAKIIPVLRNPAASQPDGSYGEEKLHLKNLDIGCILNIPE